MTALPSHTDDHPAPPAFATGDLVGCYELVRHVHSGGFGQVWIGRHALLGDRCAVKVFRDDKLGNVELEGIRRYRSVADTQPGLVPVIEVGVVPGKGYYYTMPLADDVNGRAVVRDAAEYEAMTLERYRQMHRPVRIDSVLAVAVHLLPSLHALHEAGLVHRDVKPGNIVRVEGTWKLCDFGLLARRDAIRDSCGTRPFIPPEGVSDRRADLYAFGKTLYLIATDHGQAQFQEFMDGTLRIPGNDGRRDDLQGVIQRACHPDLARRIQTALEMHQEISRLVRTTRVTVVLDDHFASFTPARLQEFLKAVRERWFHVHGVPVCEEGSVRITLELPTDEADRLVEAVEAGAFAEFRAVHAGPAGVFSGQTSDLSEPGEVGRQTTHTPGISDWTSSPLILWPIVAVTVAVAAVMGLFAAFVVYRLLTNAS